MFAERSDLALEHIYSCNLKKISGVDAAPVGSDTGLLFHYIIVGDATVLVVKHVRCCVLIYLASVGIWALP